MILEKIVFLTEAPTNTKIMWAKPIKNGFALYVHSNGIWQPLRIMDINNTPNTSDDTVAITGNGGDLAPNTVGTDQIIDNSIMVKDLNEEVRKKLEDIYILDSETLYINGTEP